MAAVSLTFRAVDEPQPGEAWRARFAELWPAYSGWYLRDGDAARPSYREARVMLQRHMPELVGAWERMVELAGGGDLAARFLSMYDPPPLVPGCSQAVYARAGAPVLVRNYDFDPLRFDAVVLATTLTGRRVLGTSDCMWGLLDGLNDAGLAVSLTFGGDRRAGRGFAIPIVVRYLLETCASVPDAEAALARLPVQAPYNLTLLDRAGRRQTLFVGPGEAPRPARVVAATNHQASVSWTQYARATRTVERQRCLLALLDDPGVDEASFVGAFLRAPLRSVDYAGAFGTLYTAVLRPADGSVEYRWPSLTWRQALDDFDEGIRTVALAGVCESASTAM